MSRLVEIGIIAILFFLVINVVFLNIFLLSHPKNTAATTVGDTDIPNSVEPACDALCEDWLLKKIEEKMPTPIIESSVEKTRVVPKEYIIPVGTGGTTAKDWEYVPSAEVTLNTRNYPPIKTVIFEVFLSIPTANGVVHAKLFNVTDKHDVWFSEVSSETDQVMKKEATIQLEPGSKVYRVMLKSTLGYEAQLHTARIRILTE